jgi:DNA-binding transcriptional LysR family regulator
VAEELHFGRAATRLHIAQPPLSQQIRRLEDEIGYPLFLRSSRSVKLTPAGEVLLERVRRTLSKVAEDLEAVRSIARGEVGSLEVGFVGSAMLTGLPGMLGQYRELYPRVQLRLRELHTSMLLDAIREGSIGVGFVRDAGPIQDLKVEPLLEEPFVVALPKAHAMAKRAAIPIERLRDEPFVFFPRTAGEYAWNNTMQLCEEQGFRAKIVQEAPQWLTVLRLVGAGLGVTIAPACVQKISAADVVCRKLLPARGRTNIDLVHRTGETSPLVQAFSDLARRLLQNPR